MIRFACSCCRNMLMVPDPFTGKNVSCPQCGQLQSIPVEAALASESDPASQPRREPVSEKLQNLIPPEALKPPLAPVELLDHVEVVESEAEDKAAAQSGSRIPRWVFVMAGIGIVACGILCGTALGLWANILDSNVPAVEKEVPLPVELAPDGRLEVQGGFSFVPPGGWVVEKFPSTNLYVVVGPPVDGFSPYIGCEGDDFTGSLQRRVEISIESFPELRAVKQEDFKQEDFKTTEGLKGIRVIVECKANGQKLRRTFYGFAKGNKQFIVICAVPAKGGKHYDPVFAAAMKTLRIDQP